MVGALNSGLSGSGSSPCQGHVLCFWLRHFTLKVSLSQACPVLTTCSSREGYIQAQVYKWVPTNLMLNEVALQWTSFPSREE